MKLLLCLKCQDLFSLQLKGERSCQCGNVKGRYVDNLNAEVSGEADTYQVIGFANSTFERAIVEQRIYGDLPPQPLGGYGVVSPGREFKAFIIPESASSVKRK